MKSIFYGILCILSLSCQSRNYIFSTEVNLKHIKKIKYQDVISVTLKNETKIEGLYYGHDESGLMILQNEHLYTIPLEDIKKLNYERFSKSEMMLGIMMVLIITITIYTY